MVENAGYWAFVGLLVAFFTYKGYNLIQMVRELAYEPYYLWQQDYVDGSAEMYEVDGVTIYVPTDRGRSGITNSRHPQSYRISSCGATRFGTASAKSRNDPAK